MPAVPAIIVVTAVPTPMTTAVPVVVSTGMPIVAALVVSLGAAEQAACQQEGAGCYD